MKRLVYSPKIEAYIKADTGIYDISEYITNFTIDRKINQVSTAELTLRNPYKKWTNNSYTDPITGQPRIGPIFHPMDPITILLTRLENHPVQVFTGFCDSTPYLQLFPGTVNIRASCTLKKLLYTYFDAGLPFMREFLSLYGWEPTENGAIVHPTAENNALNHSKESLGGVRFGDSGIGELLYHVLHEIGGWPDETIYIEEMPSSVVNLISNLFDLFKAEDETASQELNELLHNIIGTATQGTGGEPSGTGSPEAPKEGSPVTAIDIGRAMITVSSTPLNRDIIARGMTTVQHESNFGTAPGWNEEHTGGVLGYWQIQRSTHPQYSKECCMTLLCSTKAAYEISEHWTNWDPWSASDFGSSEIPQSAIEPFLSKAEKALELGAFGSGKSETSNKQGHVHR